MSTDTDRDRTFLTATIMMKRSLRVRVDVLANSPNGQVDLQVLGPGTCLRRFLTTLGVNLTLSLPFLKTVKLRYDI
jgi:hypothetical protein